MHSKRDSKGRIVSIILEDSAEDDEDTIATFETKLIYDNKGRVIRTETTDTEEQWIQNYHYGKDSLLQRRDYGVNGNDEYSTYRYVKFDEYGNWIERIEKLGSMDQTINHKRQIIYRK